MGQTASAQPHTESHSLVYFLGMVSEVRGGVVHVDLGTVHNLKERDQVAVFRAEDSVFSPLGLLTIDQCGPVSLTAPVTRKFEPRFGDFVVYVRAVAQLGTFERYRDSVLATLLLETRDRSGYSSFRREDAAAAIDELRRAFPEWHRSRSRIAGTIQGRLATSRGEAVTRPLLKQIDQYRRFEEDGVPAEVAGKEWDDVMTVLREPRLEGLLSDPEADGGAESEIAVTDPNAIPGPTQTIVQVGRSLRSLVQDRLFDRPQEIQNLAVVYATRMFHRQPSQEATWLRRELNASQFNWLSQDEQFIIDVSNLLQSFRDQQANSN
ncbi:MAG: hypothetical protein KDA96_01600 [Planctomycetaceae bacterium]|nr:hypothetical protein [Planctomycetaceae bacterium]